MGTPLNHLQGGKINLKILREASKSEFLTCLESCPGPKVLIWDDELIGRIGAVAEFSLLKERDVIRMFPLQPGKLPAEIKSNVNVIFITRTKLALMNIIADNIKQEEIGRGREEKKEFHIIFVPRKSLLCDRRLKELGVFGTFVSTQEFPLDIIPLDNDLLSMETPGVHKECTVDGDRSSLYNVARSLMTIQALYGVIPSIHSKGSCAKTVCEMICNMRREASASPTNPSHLPPQIDELIVLDRSVDPLTPLPTQLTYEGLIDECYGIDNGSCKFPGEKFQQPESSPSSSNPFATPTPPEPKQVSLNSAEELFAEIRDKNFNAIGPALSRKAKTLAAMYEEKKEAHTVSQMKQFVMKLPHIQAMKQSLSIHTSVAELLKELVQKDGFMENLEVEQEFLNAINTERVNEYVEDCIARQEPLIKILRLLCMQCVTSNGLRPKVLDFYRREIIQTYGFQHVITLDNLSKSGYLSPPTNKTYQSLKRMMKLMADDVNEQNPTDIHYVYSCYAPLSVRVIQGVTKPGWRMMRDVMDLLPGETWEDVQPLPTSLRKKNTSHSSLSGIEEPKLTLVFFIGGVTYAEIAALRYLSSQEDASAEYIIATTKVINGTSLMKSMMETLEPSVLF